MLLVSTGLLVLVSPAIPSDPWLWPKPDDLAFLALAGASLACANYCLIRALQLADASFIAPFRYSTMLWAIPFGVLVWGDWPKANVLFGSVLLIGSGIYLFTLASRHAGTELRSEFRNTGQS
jgi:drug/metabolite transporter (DMT)-like permease